MKRIVVLGIPGSGKSTISRFVGNRFAIPVLHLDTIFWLPNWEKAPVESFVNIHSEWLTKPSWVIDGNYRRTLGERLALADTVILLRFSSISGLWFAFLRYWKERGKTRPDMTPGCVEKFDWEFIRWILRFNRDVLPELEKTLLNYPNVTLICLKNRRQVKLWMADLEHS